MANRRRSSNEVDNYFYSAVKARVKKNTAQSRVMRLRFMYERVISELAVNRFKWTGLPEEIDPRYIELCLYRNALSVFFFDSKKYDKYMAMSGSPSGQRNALDEPLQFTVTGSNYVSQVLDYDECVPIWSNYFRTPDLDIVLIYAERLAEIDRTIDINTASARRTKILAYDENSQLSATNINRMLDNGESVIPVNMQIDEMIKSIDLGVEPESLEKLSIFRNRIYNDCMSLLGIYNHSGEKKERLVSDEVSANDDQIDAIRRVNLNARQFAANRINEKYGLNVEVDYFTQKTDNVTDSNEPIDDESEDEGDGDDADVYY